MSIELVLMASTKAVKISKKHLLGIEDLNVSDVSQVEILTGAFSAEYGQAQSGVVNITTKTGGTKFAVNFDFKTDNGFLSLIVPNKLKLVEDNLIFTLSHLAIWDFCIRVFSEILLKFPLILKVCFSFIISGSIDFSK